MDPLLDPRDHLKCYCLTQEEFDALPEYSISRPTGAVSGTQWKSHYKAHRNYMDCWIVCEFLIKYNLGATYHYKPVIVSDPPPDDLRRVWVGVDPRKDFDDA